MKHVYLFLFFILFGSYQAKAVLPDGTVAPNWTLTDLNGNTHNLHNILNSGKHVILDFSATWCGPCWNYHNTHALSTLWNLYGPNGTDEIMVFFIEGDVNTTTPCLYGLPTCQGGTQGDWVTGTPYPIIDLLTNEVRNQYQITYFPTLYGIRAQDKRVFEVGQRSVSQWETWLFESFAMDYTATIEDNTCRGNGSVSLDVTDGYGSKFYQWSSGGPSSPTITGLQAGTYNCRITDSNGYFVDTEDFIVEGVPDLEAILDERIDVLCNGDANGILEVSADGGSGTYTYEWDNGETSQRIENLSPGTYTVTIIDGYDCDVVSDFVITEPSALFGTAYTFDAPCNDDEGYVELSGLFGTAPYLYDMGGTPQTDPYFYNLPIGTYDYNVTDANGCLYTGEFFIEQIPGPNAVAATQGNLSCTQLQTTVTGQGSATGQNITYQWTTQNGQIVSGANSLNAVVNAAGTYTLKVTNTSNQCFNEASTVVVMNGVLPQALVADALPLTCTATERTLDGTGSSQGSEYTYLWSTTNGNIVSGETTLTPVVNEPGDYQLQVTNTSNGCVKTTTETVNENVALPPLSVTNGEITCTQTSVELCGTTDTLLSIVWTIGEEEITANCVTVSVVGEIQASVTGDNGCVTLRTATVTASADLPQVSVSNPDEVTCTQAEVGLLATLQGNPEDFTIVWTTTNGNIVSGENTLTPVVNSGGVYNLSVVNNANGCTTNKSVSVEEDTDLPVSSFVYEQEGENLELSSTVTGEGVTILWDLGNGTTSTDPEVNVKFDVTGLYTICLTATNECGDDVTCTEILYVTTLKTTEVLTQVSCFNGQNGSIIVTPEGGLPDYEIVWEGPNGFASTSFELTGLSAGIYKALVSDAHGNVVEITHEITQPSEMVQTSVEIINEVNGNGQGSVHPEVTGGTGSYTYEWSNGANTKDLDKIGAGSYTLVVKDENGCEKTFGPYVVENTVNAENVNFVKNFTVSPNPSTDKVVVDFTLIEQGQKVDLSVYNSFGQLIMTQDMSSANQTTIDVSVLVNGLYSVEIRSGKQKATKKLVVIH